MYKLLFVIIFCSGSAFSDQFELVTGSYAYHFFGGEVSHKFSNKVSPDGRLITAKLLGIRNTHIFKSKTYLSEAVFIGENSVAKPIYGGVLSFGEILGNWQAGLVCGFYKQDDSEFLKKEIMPFSLAGTGIVPLIGAEVNYKISFSRNYFMKINNVLTPIATNHNISFGVNF